LAADAFVCLDAQIEAAYAIKTGETAVILNRRQQAGRQSKDFAYGRGD
jgi:hypothetical protein